MPSAHHYVATSIDGFIARALISHRVFDSGVVFLRYRVVRPGAAG